MLEPLSYALKEGSKLSSSEKQYVVVESARRLTPLGVDVLKAEFPMNSENTGDLDESGWLAACKEITEASLTPWILLSAAVDFDTFTRQVSVACRAGASGVAVGRAVWQEAITLGGDQRLDFLRNTARTRLSRLSSLCHTQARPYTDFYTVEAPFDWYQKY